MQRPKRPIWWQPNRNELKKRRRERPTNVKRIYDRTRHTNEDWIHSSQRPKRPIGWLVMIARRHTNEDWIHSLQRPKRPIWWQPNRNELKKRRRERPTNVKRIYDRTRHTNEDWIHSSQRPKRPIGWLVMFAAVGMITNRFSTLRSLSKRRHTNEDLIHSQTRPWLCVTLVPQHCAHAQHLQTIERTKHLCISIIALAQHLRTIKRT